MVHAFVLVKTAAGKSEKLLNAVQDLQVCTEAHIIAGDYDLILEVDGEEVYDILRTASTTVQEMEGVLETKTYISMQ